MDILQIALKENEIISFDIYSNNDKINLASQRLFNTVQNLHIWVSEFNFYGLNLDSAPYLVIKTKYQHTTLLSRKLTKLSNISRNLKWLNTLLCVEYFSDSVSFPTCFEVCRVYPRYCKIVRNDKDVWIYRDANFEYLYIAKGKTIHF